MKQPLIGFCLAFCSGILLKAYLEIPFLILYVLAFLSLLFSVVFVRRPATFDVFVLCAFFLLGALSLKNSQLLPRHHIAQSAFPRSTPVSLIGSIDSDPTSSIRKDSLHKAPSKLSDGVYQIKNTSFILKAEEMKTGEMWQKTCGKVLVKVFKQEQFSYGDRVMLEGKLYRPLSFSGSGFNYREYLAHQGIYRLLSVKKDALAERLGSNVGNPLKSLAFRTKHRLKNVMVEHLSPFSARLLSAILLGERHNLPDSVREALVKSGSVHIIAISGIHLGIVAFITLLLLKIMRVPRRLRYMLTIFLLIIYCILTGARVPVVRATVMAVILLFGYFLGREVNIYNSLSLAALVILAVNPSQIFDVSFQLSFLSVFSIVWLTPKIKSLFPAKLRTIAWMRFLILTFSVSTAAWVGLAPLIAYRFRIIAPVTVLANMIIVPYMSVIIASGFTLALMGRVMPPVASLFAASCELFIVILFKINSLLIAIPGAYFKLSPFSCGYVVVYYALLISMVNFPKILPVVHYARANVHRLHIIRYRRERTLTKRGHL